MKSSIDISEGVRAAVELALTEPPDDDPFGSAYLLHVCLEASHRTAWVDNLSDWMNEWIEKVLVKWECSTNIDKEVASAVLGLLSIEKHSKLKKAVNNNVLLEKLAGLFDPAKGFFGNFTYTCIIYRYLSLQHKTANLTGKVRDYLTAKLSKMEALFNDPFNLLMWRGVLDTGDFPKEKKRLVDFCWEKIRDDRLHHSQRAYYAYIAWTLSDGMSIEQKAQTKDYALGVLKGFNVKGFPETEFEREMHGGAITLKPSRILVGVYFSLAEALKPDIVVLLREEFEKPSVFTRTGGLIFFLLGATLSIAVLGLLIKYVAWANLTGQKQHLTKSAWDSREYWLLLLMVVSEMGVLLLGLVILFIMGIYTIVIFKNVAWHSNANFGLTSNEANRLIREQIRKAVLGSILLSLITFLLL